MNQSSVNIIPFIFILIITSLINLVFINYTNGGDKIFSWYHILKVFDNQKIYKDWMPQTGPIYSLIIYFFFKIGLNIKFSYFFLTILNNLLFVFISYLISSKIYNKNTTLFVVIITALFFNNFFGGFYWDFLAITFSYFCFYILFYCENTFKKIILSSIFLILTFHTKIQIGCVLFLLVFFFHLLERNNFKEFFINIFTSSSALLLSIFFMIIFYGFDNYFFEFINFIYFYFSQGDNTQSNFGYLVLFKSLFLPFRINILSGFINLHLFVMMVSPLLIILYFSLFKLIISFKNKRFRILFYLYFFYSFLTFFLGRGWLHLLPLSFIILGFFYEKYDFKIILKFYFSVFFIFLSINSFVNLKDYFNDKNFYFTTPSGIIFNDPGHFWYLKNFNAEEIKKDILIFKNLKIHSGNIFAIGEYSNLLLTSNNLVNCNYHPKFRGFDIYGYNYSVKESLDMYKFEIENNCKQVLFSDDVLNKYEKDFFLKFLLENYLLIFSNKNFKVFSRN